MTTIILKQCFLCLEIAIRKEDRKKLSQSLYILGITTAKYYSFLKTYFFVKIMTLYSIEEIKKIRKDTRYLKSSNFYADSSSVQMAFMSPETLDVTISIDEVTSYVNGIEYEVDKQKRIKNQILSHEAFHVYQALHSPLLAEYSLTERRILMQKLRVLEELVKLRYSCFDDELPIVLDSHTAELRSYAYDIANDNKIASEKIYGNPREEKFSIIEIIEGAAVCYQYLADDDLAGEVIKFDSPEYTSAWNYFHAKSRGKMQDCRVIFLFMCDIYIKFLGKSHDVADDFDNYIQLSVTQIDKISHYQNEFFLGKDANRQFLKSLKTIGLTQLEIDIILNYTASLIYENQAKLYVYIRAYVELFKCLTLAGSAERRSSNNKHISIRRSLEARASYWKTDLIIPCTLSNNNEVKMFSNSLCNSKNVNYIDDFGMDKITNNSEEVKSINFIKRVEPIICRENVEVFCCSEHGFKKRHIVLGCANPSSLNSEFRKKFNITLREFLDE